MSAQLKDLTSLKQPTRAATGQVRISYGVHSLEVATAGKSVAEGPRVRRDSSSS